MYWVSVASEHTRFGKEEWGDPCPLLGEGETQPAPCRRCRIQREGTGSDSVHRPHQCHECLDIPGHANRWAAGTV